MKTLLFLKISSKLKRYTLRKLSSIYCKIESTLQIPEQKSKKKYSALMLNSKPNNINQPAWQTKSFNMVQNFLLWPKLLSTSKFLPHLGIISHSLKPLVIPLLQNDSHAVNNSKHPLLGYSNHLPRISDFSTYSFQLNPRFPLINFVLAFVNWVSIMPGY